MGAVKAGINADEPNDEDTDLNPADEKRELMYTYAANERYNEV